MYKIISNNELIDLGVTVVRFNQFVGFSSKGLNWLYKKIIPILVESHNNLFDQLKWWICYNLLYLIWWVNFRKSSRLQQTPNN